MYIDPPYNQHSYFSNYHVWETLIRWDRPAHYGIANKREDCRTTKSRLQLQGPRGRGDDGSARTPGARPWVVVSVSDEGYHDPAQVAALLGGAGTSRSLDVDYKRYVGAQIGIHNPRGERVGSVSHLRNTEHLIVAGPDARVITQVKRLQL